MTKEKVLKRFEFDVNIGVLKHISNKYGEIICPFDNLEDEDLKFLSEVFKKLGYEKDNSNKWLNYKNADGISISLTNKNFWFYELEPHEKHHNNKIPEYLEEFMEQVDDEK